MSLQDKNERSIEELKLSLAQIRRDIIERLGRIEEYISYLDTDVRRLRLELQRINDKMYQTEYDQNILQRQTAYEPAHGTYEDKAIQIKQPEEPKASMTTPTVTSISTSIKNIEKREGLNQTEVAIIKYLIDNPGTKSATPIAQSINKAREHVARTLKKLAEEKKIIRDETTWPYTYVVPEEIKNMVMQDTSS
uniref:Uncharacterized protein n=1 Tax=Candidatus Methanomethylicus mesodigestus TaxID=1867258 RepID=A0A7C3J431_9CREN